MSVVRILTLWITSVSAIVGAPEVTKIGDISQQSVKEHVTVAGMIEKRSGTGHNVYLTLSDDTGTITVLLIAKLKISTERLQKGTPITVHGRVEFDKGKSYQGQLLVIPESNADITGTSGVKTLRPKRPSGSTEPLPKGTATTVDGKVKPEGPESNPRITPTSGVKKPGRKPLSVLLSYWPFGLIVIALICLGIVIVRTRTKVTELEHRINSRIEVAAMIKAAIEQFKHQDESLADEIPLLNERVTVLIPKEGMEAPEIFLNETIRSEFRDGIDNAEKRIDIESPWINPWVIQQLLPHLESALQKGVKVRIVYGYTKQGLPDGKKDDTENQAVLLRKRWNHYGSRFQMRYGPTHRKTFICDDEFLLIGSFNFLSFAGVFKADTNSEIVAKIRDKKVIRKLRTETFDF